VAEVLNDHITLEVEGIDRMHVNVYVPRLQCEHAVVPLGAPESAVGVVGTDEPDESAVHGGAGAFI
jgi:hypothetical protein